MTKATASPEAKTAEENLRKAHEELAKATQAYQLTVKKSRLLQQEALALRNAGKPAGNAAVATTPRQAPRDATPTQNGQPNAPVHPTSAIPRPSELFDN
jgi:hypothetical protein